MDADCHYPMARTSLLCIPEKYVYGKGLTGTISCIILMYPKNREERVQMKRCPNMFDQMVGRIGTSTGGFVLLLQGEKIHRQSLVIARVGCNGNFHESEEENALGALSAIFLETNALDWSPKRTVSALRKVDCFMTYLLRAGEIMNMASRHEASHEFRVYVYIRTLPHSSFIEVITRISPVEKRFMFFGEATDVSWKSSHSRGVRALQNIEWKIDAHIRNRAPSRFKRFQR